MISGDECLARSQDHAYMETKMLSSAGDEEDEEDEGSPADEY